MGPYKVLLLDGCSFADRGRAPLPHCRSSFPVEAASTAALASLRLVVTLPGCGRQLQGAFSWRCMACSVLPCHQLLRTGPTGEADVCPAEPVGGSLSLGCSVRNQFLPHTSVLSISVLPVITTSLSPSACVPGPVSKAFRNLVGSGDAYWASGTPARRRLHGKTLVPQLAGIPVEMEGVL